MCGTCWSESQLMHLNVSLVIHGRPSDPSWGYNWDANAEPLVTHGDMVPCPATAPSSSQIIDLATAMMSSRPRLKTFSVLVECSTNTQPSQKQLGVATWKLEHPFSTPVTRAVGTDTVPYRSTHFSIISSPIAGDMEIAYTVTGGHAESACCVSLREQEIAMAEEAAADEREFEERRLLWQG
jgi:hypothetical protein